MIDGVGSFTQIFKRTFVKDEITVKVICRDCNKPMKYLASHRKTYPHLFVCYKCNNGCEIELESKEIYPEQQNITEVGMK